MGTLCGRMDCRVNPSHTHSPRCLERKGQRGVVLLPLLNVCMWTCLFFVLIQGNWLKDFTWTWVFWLENTWYLPPSLKIKVCHKSIYFLSKHTLTIFITSTSAPHFPDLLCLTWQHHVDGENRWKRMLRLWAPVDNKVVNTNIICLHVKTVQWATTDK